VRIYFLDYLFGIIERGEEKDNGGDGFDLTPSPSTLTGTRPEGEGDWSAGDRTVGGWGLSAQRVCSLI